MTARITGNVLVVDDDLDILQAARLYLKQHVTNIHTESNPQRIPTLMQNERYDVILLDMNFTRDTTSGKEGFYWLKRIRELDPDVVVILITAFGDVETAVKAIKEGATDFVLKPWRNEKLLATISSAVHLHRARREADRFRTRQQNLADEMDQPFHDFIGESSAMRDVFHTIAKVAATDANVLILGENGTGKELVARAVHRQSTRLDEVFISVDMGAITETLFESQLFGHMKGSFTDAHENRAGRFEAADGGTLFLDEIGNLSMPLQSKLLQALETRTITRVGATRPIPMDIRLISATNMPIQRMVQEGSFRQDLLFRINTVEIHIPPLRDRKTDIPLLVDHFLKIYADRYRKEIRGVDSGAMDKLTEYEWPGNVRELQHALERAVIMTDGPDLKPADFPLRSDRAIGDELALPSWNLDDVEKTVIRKVLSKAGGNVSHAAKELGLTRAALYRRMDKHGL